VPLLALVGLLLFITLAFVVLLPLSLVQRYRVGTSRQPARGWLLTLNLAGILLSVALFLATAALTSFWIPNTFTYSALGLSAGGLLGLIGLGLTRWEPTARTLHYTPNRWLVLGITLVVAVRLLYGFWRGWQNWNAALQGAEWLAASGAAGSFAAGAVVLGYYLAYWTGVRRRLARHRRSVS
jgi:hypothetical protein